MAPSCQPFWSNSWLLTCLVLANQNFFNHFEFEIEIIVGQFDAKKLPRTNIGIISLGLPALGHQPKFVYNKNYILLFCFRPEFHFSDQYLVKWLRKLDKSPFFVPPQPLL